MTIDVATGISRILEEGVGWVSTFPVCRVNNALGREGAVAGTDDARRPLRRRGRRLPVLAHHRGLTDVGVCTFQGGVNAAGMQYAAMPG